MPVSRNALIRYKTIDTCLRNRFRKWTLEDLVDACSDALYEYEGIDKGISKRTVQMDIQLMRSEKLGYNAPIVVKDHKYYTYEDPEYSITNTPLSEQDLKVMSEAVELLKSGRINNRLLCEIVTNDKFEQLMTDTEIYIDGHATSTFRTLYESLEEQRQTIIQKYKQAENDFYSKTILAAEVKEEDFFCHVTHKTWDAILHDIRKAHEHDIDSTPDYSLAKKMALEIRKAIQSSGDYLGKVWAVIFNMLGIDFYKLPPDEQKILKRILSKSPNIKNSPFNFRRKRK